MDRDVAAIVLGIPNNASLHEARQAYRARARLLHPDRLAGMSGQDIRTAHEAMAQLNDAFSAFEKQPQSTDADQQSSRTRQRTSPPQAQTPMLVGSFEVIWHSSLGGSVNGIVLVYESQGEGRTPVFRSNEHSFRGEPLISGTIALLPDEQPRAAGRLDLLTGGHLLVKGGKNSAQELMDCLSGGPARQATSTESERAWRSEQPAPDPGRQSDSNVDLVVDCEVKGLRNLTGPRSTFVISIEPGEVAISSCVEGCQERGYHSCALSWEEACDLVNALTSFTDYQVPVDGRISPDLDDIAITRMNPGQYPPKISLDWRANWNRNEDGDAADRAWRCVSLEMQGSCDDPSSQLGQFLRALSAAVDYARLWESGDVDSEQVAEGMRHAQ